MYYVDNQSSTVFFPCSAVETLICSVVQTRPGSARSSGSRVNDEFAAIAASVIPKGRSRPFFQRF